MFRIFAPNLRNNRRVRRRNLQPLQCILSPLLRRKARNIRKLREEQIRPPRLRYHLPKNHVRHPLHRRQSRKPSRQLRPNILPTLRHFYFFICSCTIHSHIIAKNIEIVKPTQSPSATPKKQTPIKPTFNKPLPKSLFNIKVLTFYKVYDTIRTIEALSLAPSQVVSEKSRKML